MDYLPGHLEANHHKKVMEKIKQALEDFKDLPIDEDSYMGVVGEGGDRFLDPGKGRVLGLGSLGGAGEKGLKGESPRFGNGKGWDADSGVPQGLANTVSLPFILQFCIIKLQLPEGNGVG